MPELPEVETMVRGIRPHVEGRKILAVRKCRCRCKPITTAPSLRRIAGRMTGQTVTRVHRLAKRVVLDIASGESLVIEPRMTGLMLLADPPDRGHLRIEWKLDGKGEFNSLWFWDRRGLGTVRLFQPGEIEHELIGTRLGPDALEMNRRRWGELCGSTKRAIKVALLDQKLVAGIGNLYASEILHLARIHPAALASTLSEDEIGRLARAAKRVLRLAIEYEGSTLNDATYRNALNQNGRYQNEHRVYGKAGSPCPTCGDGEIVRTVQCQRSTFFCPACQLPGN